MIREDVVNTKMIIVVKIWLKLLKLYIELVVYMLLVFSNAHGSDDY